MIWPVGESSVCLCPELEENTMFLIADDENQSETWDSGWIDKCDEWEESIQSRREEADRRQSLKEQEMCRDIG